MIFNQPPRLLAAAMLIALGLVPSGMCAAILPATSPAAAQHMLWQIGQFDTNNAEFALAPNHYESFDEDGLFIIGHSDLKAAWPYVHPGPEDNWAGAREHSFAVRFGIKQSAPEGKCRLLVDLLDTHQSRPPTLNLEINGQKFEQKLPPGAGNHSISGQPAKGKPYRFAIEFPSGLLKAGDNQLHIRSVAGSWLLYDRVALETPPGVEGIPVQNIPAPPTESPSREVRVTVDTARVVNTLRGGIGASWHAIEEPIPVSDKPHPIFPNKSHGGSGWGAYPPAEDEGAWAQIDRHARWLGLDWNRVEIEQRIYEPERGQFSWDNPEMRILYRILDWCERHQADVFLQQMWGNVRWNTFPEWRDDPVARVHSGPLSLEDFGEGLATLVEHLIKTKRYTCIRWLSINNEPNGNWSWWQAPPNHVLPLKPGLAAVRQALDKRGLSLPLSGPDRTGGVPELNPKQFDFHELLGAYDFHSYDENFDWNNKGQMLRYDRNTAAWAAWAHQQGKPLFMSEFGTMANGWGAAHRGPGSYESVLKDCELVVRRLNAGADGFNRWSFINRGDLDGQWQFIETWDRKAGKLLQNYTPHPNTYFGVGLLSRFAAKHSAVLACQVEGGSLQKWQRVFATALRSPKGNLTLMVINDAPAEFDLALELGGLARAGTFYRYGITAQDRDRDDLKIAPQTEFPLSASKATLRDQLAPGSITIYSTYKLAHSDPGIVAE